MITLPSQPDVCTCTVVRLPVTTDPSLYKRVLVSSGSRLRCATRSSRGRPLALAQESEGSRCPLRRRTRNLIVQKVTRNAETPNTSNLSVAVVPMTHNTTLNVTRTTNCNPDSPIHSTLRTHLIPTTIHHHFTNIPKSITSLLTSINSQSFTIS